MENQDSSDLKVSIKEFAEFVGVKQSVLRYYDEIGLFHPAIRGGNSYRYYTLPQIQTVKLIETLRALNIPLKKIEEIIDSRTPESMLELFAEYEVKLNNELRALQESFSLIHTLRTQIQVGQPADLKELSVKFFDGARISLGPLTDFEPDESYHRVFSNYYRVARRLRVNLSYPIGGYYDTLEEFLESPTRPKRYFSLDPNGFDIMQAGNYLSGYSKGGYGTVDDLPDRLSDYIQTRKLKPTGPVYHTYPLNEVCVEDPDNYVSCVTIRLS